MPKLLFFITLVFSLSSAWAQLPEQFTEPVPLVVESEGGIKLTPNANRLHFFPHPAVPGSSVNFQEALSHVEYGDDLAADVYDLLGAPGFSVTSAIKQSAENMAQLLADPAGLCFENLLMNLTCSSEALIPLQKPSWQLLVADLRNYLPGETRIDGLATEVKEVTLAGHPDWAPYHQFGLSALVGGGSGAEGSPPAICYDVAAAEDWIACPVFGKINVTGHAAGVGHQNVEVPNPVIIYRLSEEDGRYHLAGYLANPIFPLYYDLYDEITSGEPNPDRRVRRGSAYFPMAIAVGNFAVTDAETEEPVEGGYADIAVMGTATLPHAICGWFAQEMAEADLERLPWDLSCAYGLVWARVHNGWDQPVRELFDSRQTLIGAPKIYSMAAGLDGEEARLFAASNAPAPDGKFYILKYYDRSLIEQSHVPSMGDLVPPRLIEARPPPGGDGTFGPFQIVVSEINGDGFADFAVTWKKTEETLEDILIDTEHHLWKGTYSPYFSVFVSRSLAGRGAAYDQFDFPGRKLGEMTVDPDAQIASVAFGQVERQKYLVAGNNKRIQTEEGDYHAFVYVFPISGGVIDNLNTKMVRVSFEGGGADTPGVGDLAVSPGSFAIAASLHDPFLPAPESCNVSDGYHVYGDLWLGRLQTEGGTVFLLDADNDGVPNRCETCSLGNPEGADSDGDELPDDSAGCDNCPGHPDLDWEVDVSGRLAGDGVPDACDNCPPSRCAAYPYEFEREDCINLDQENTDGDGVGDSCDGCPKKEGLTLMGIYFWGERLTGCSDSACYTCPGDCAFCSYCVNAYLAFDGGTYSVEAGTELETGVRNCAEFIRAPRGLGRYESWDVDGDGVPNARDNCVFRFNPPPAEYQWTFGNEPSGQPDSDGDGSGDVCDCDWDGHWDDCDRDGIPNRFDSSPGNAVPPSARRQIPDSIYDPYAGFIAHRRDLKPAQFFFDNIEPTTIDPGPTEPPAEGGARDLMVIPSAIWNVTGTGEQPQRCGYPQNTWPGPDPCDWMGRSGREVNVILPSRAVEPPPPPCVVGEDPECTPPPPPPPPPPCVAGVDPGCTEVPPGLGRNVAQFCIAEVGRRDPTTAAVGALEQAQIIEANNRIQAITGIENFDIVVGAEGGHIHYECAFLGGAMPGVSVAHSDSVLPNVSGNVAPYALIQTAGLPPHLNYERRPDPDIAIRPPEALLIGPVAPAAEEEGEAALSLALPNLSIALPDREISQISGERVQFGTLSQNVNNRLVYKVLTAESDFTAAKTNLAVSGPYSLFVMDAKMPPEPWSNVPVEQRKDKIELLINSLQIKADQWRAAGWPITPEIYAGLDWNEPMVVEFLVAQSTVPEAVVEANRSVSDPANVLPEGYINRVVLPAYVKGIRAPVAGGCGCHIPTQEFSILSILYLLCLVAPVPALMYYRRRHEEGPRTKGYGLRTKD